MKKLYTIYYHNDSLTMNDCHYFDNAIKTGMIEHVFDDVVSFHDLHGQDVSLAIKLLHNRFPSVHEFEVVAENAKTMEEISSYTIKY